MKRTRKEMHTVQELPVSTSSLDFGGTSLQVDETVRDELTRRWLVLEGASTAGNDELRTLARTFDAHHYIVRYYLPKNEGAGYWDIYRVSRDLFVMIADCEYLKPTWLGSPGEQCLKIRYLQTGQLLREDQSPLLSAHEAMYAAYPGEEGDGYFVAANTRCRLAVVQCSIAAITDELAFNYDENPKLIELLGDAKSRLPFSRKFEPSAGIVSAFSELMDKRDELDLKLRCWFVEAKSKDIITSLVHRVFQERDRKVGPNRISPRDHQRVLEARELLVAHIKDVPTIAELSRMVGISQTRLKLAFKEIFGVTIRTFTTEQRMREAARMLIQTNLNIAQIGRSIGYSHSGNFSQAFKRYYGRVPREYRRSATIAPRRDSFSNNPPNRAAAIMERPEGRQQQRL
ncbi:MAG: helix-turn-helix transcriptional regulator [Gammaproteobacteria bacterium]|nr:helix-turn-helix transcriptional regulator [Chromatiales bacterium]MYE49716.1 helix-turn-helix transcriptional regulator [Gammaproteobacteria bacterium]